MGGRNVDMASLFGWVDFSDEDREKMYELIRLFSERDIRMN